MKLIRALIPLGLLLLPLFVKAADPFEGTIAVTMKNDADNKAPQAMTYSVKNGLLRIDVNSARGAVGMIMDIKNRTMTIIMPQQQMYMQNSFPAPDTAAAQAKAAADHTDIKDTGEKDTIMGYTCEKYVVTNDHGTTQLWLAPDLSGFNAMFSGQSPMSRHQQVPEAWQNVIKNGGGFPMRVITSDGKGEKFRMEVTAVSPQKLSDSLFTPPAEYRKFDMGALMNGGGRPPGS